MVHVYVCIYVCMVGLKMARPERDVKGQLPRGTLTTGIDCRASHFLYTEGAMRQMLSMKFIYLRQI